MENVDPAMACLVLFRKEKSKPGSDWLIYLYKSVFFGRTKRKLAFLLWHKKRLWLN
jgi:hypothetical protein